MKPVENMKNSIKKLTVRPSDEIHSRVLNKLMIVLDESKKQTAVNQPNIWRMIMNSKITKFATVAAVLVTITSAVTILDHMAEPAYAIEQTIVALEEKTTVHMFCRDWDGEEMEIWMTLNRDSGLPDYLYIDYPRYDAIILSTPSISFQYLKEINLVQITHKQLINFDLRFEKIIEDIALETTTIGDDVGANIKISREIDPETGKELIIILANSKNHTVKLIVDAETKLPTGLHFLRHESPGSFLKDIDEIFFYEELPERIFDFTIPKDALVVDKDEQAEFEDDPNYGISTEGLSQQEAASLIAKEYCLAMIDFDFERIKKIYPRAGLGQGGKLKALYDRIFKENKPIELVEVGKFYWQRGCSIGPVVPCLVKFEDGAVKRFNIIVKFRQIDDRGSCVISGMYGLPRKIE